MNISVKVEAVTPDMAVAWCDLIGPKQRIYRHEYAKYLGEVMKRNQWRLNGEAIKFSAEGHLIDGQHRLHAVYLAQKTIEFVVMRGIPEDVYPTLDTGKRRQVGDVFKMDGEENATICAAAIKLVIAAIPVIKHEKPWRALVGATKATAIDCQEYLRGYPKIRASVKLASAHWGRLLHPSIAASVHWLFRQSTPADTFVKGMDEGFHPTFKDQQALHFFRERMMENKMSHHKLRRDQILPLAILALNSAIEGKPIKELVWTPDQKFPQPLKV